MQDIPDNSAAKRRPGNLDVDLSQKKIIALEDKDLPQMVDWFSPIVLAKVGLRTLLSTVIGDYADQRPMQAAHDDPDDELDLCRRHDYRDTRPQDMAAAQAGKSLKFDADGALWVDFIADLGDGFEATYAMAYMMAQKKLEVAGIPPEEAPGGLPAGEILILGGDLAYPDATIKEYNDRCVTPYNDAFRMKPGETPKRKLFFIAGNHDWYDGLAAFTSVFCAARDRFSKGKGKKIGGWQCEQRRSYFALGLPYNWWVWGIDLALNVTIDDAQKDYFELMSSQTKADEKIIIILHAPLWQVKGEMKYLHEISELARNKGAEVVAVLAGDLHFYSRYHTQSERLDMQLITSGGGGAFAHPTHQEPTKKKIKWPLPKEQGLLPRVEADYVDTTVSASAENECAPGDERCAFDAPEDHDFRASSAHFYPSRMKSRFLSLKNFGLPFRNRGMAIFLGVIYMLYAWVFQITVADPADAIKTASLVEVEKVCRFISLDEKLEKCIADGYKAANDRHEKIFDPSYSMPENTPTGDTAQSAPQPDAESDANTPPAGPATPAETPDAEDSVPDTPAKAEDAAAASPPASTATPEEQLKLFVEKVTTLLPVYGAIWEQPLGSLRLMARLATDMFNWVLAPNFSPKRISQAMLSNPALFAMIMGLWVGLIGYADFKSKLKFIKWPVKIALGTTHFAAHLGLLLTTNAIFDLPYQWMVFSDSSTMPWIIAGAGIYTALMLLIGGFLGGALFGTYSALTSFFGAMHMDAFSAIGIKDYKNFLRMRFDKDGGLAIYAVGLDKIPGRKDWRHIDPSNDGDVESFNDHNPLIVPKAPLRPKLIDKIVGHPTGAGPDKKWTWTA